jgi:hypothetical protein
LAELERRITASIVSQLAGVVEDPGDGSFSRSAVLHILRAILVDMMQSPETTRVLIALQFESLDPDHPAQAQMAETTKLVVERITGMFAPNTPKPDRAARRAVPAMDV